MNKQIWIIFAKLVVVSLSITFLFASLYSWLNPPAWVAIPTGLFIGCVIYSFGMNEVKKMMEEE